MSSTSDPWVWLAQEGHRILRDVRLLSMKPIKIDMRTHRLDAVQQALLEEQLRFRQRSRDRFPEPDRWLWTDRSLQQASDWASASYKASLIAPEIAVVDACCGAGSDLVALAMEHEVVGIDRDSRMVDLARANLEAHELQAEVCVGDIPSSLGDLNNVALHIDPDRRVGEERSTRTTHGEAFSPSLAQCVELGQRARVAIIKLAPATEVVFEDGWAADWRRCWLGTQRECPQQLLLRGDTQLQIPAGQVAAVIARSDANPQAYCGELDVDVPLVTEPDTFIVEPHPSLYAAGLVPAWAVENNLSAITHPRGYYTGDQTTPTPWAQSFRVLARFAFDDRRLRKWLRSHDAGLLEVKSRLINVDASDLQRRYSQPQGRPLVCLLTRSGKGLRAIMAERFIA